MCTLLAVAGVCHSPKRLFCTKSSVHGISVIKTRWSFTTEIVNSSFYCNELYSLFLSQGIGDSGQGLLNGLLFVFCAGNVLGLLLNAIRCRPIKTTGDRSFPETVNYTESSPLLVKSLSGRLPVLMESGRSRERSMNISQKICSSQKHGSLLGNFRFSPTLSLDD